MDFGLETKSINSVSEVAEPLLQELCELWFSARDKAGGIPTREHLGLPFSAPPILPYLVLFDVERPLRYRYRLLGTELVRYMGSDYTGKYTDEVLDGAFLKLINRLNDNAVEKGMAEYSRFYQPWRSVERYARIALPVRSTAAIEQPDQLLVLVELAFTGQKKVTYTEGGKEFGKAPAE